MALATSYTLDNPRTSTIKIKNKSDNNITFGYITLTPSETKAVDIRRLLDSYDQVKVLQNRNEISFEDLNVSSIDELKQEYDNSIRVLASATTIIDPTDADPVNIRHATVSVSDMVEVFQSLDGTSTYEQEITVVFDTALNTAAGQYDIDLTATVAEHFGIKNLHHVSASVNYEDAGTTRCSMPSGTLGNWTMEQTAGVATLSHRYPITLFDLDTIAAFTVRVIVRFKD